MTNAPRLSLLLFFIFENSHFYFVGWEKRPKAPIVGERADKPDQPVMQRLQASVNFPIVSQQFRGFIQTHPLVKASAPLIRSKRHI